MGAKMIETKARTPELPHGPDLSDRGNLDASAPPALSGTDELRGKRIQGLLSQVRCSKTIQHLN